MLSLKTPSRTLLAQRGSLLYLSQATTQTTTHLDSFGTNGEHRSALAFGEPKSCSMSGAQRRVALIKVPIARVLLASLSFALACGILIGGWLYADRKTTLDECLRAAEGWAIQSDIGERFGGCDTLAREAAMKHEARAYRFMALRSEISGDFAAARRHWETAIKLGDNEANLALISLISSVPGQPNCKRIGDALDAYKADTDSERIRKYEMSDFVMSGDCPFSDEARRRALGPNWSWSAPK